MADAAAAEREVRPDVLVICAYIVLAPGAQPDEASLEIHCAQHLAGYKRPKKFVFVDRLPRTRNGKIARRLLQDFT